MEVLFFPEKWSVPVFRLCVPSSGVGAVRSSIGAHVAAAVPGHVATHVAAQLRSQKQAQSSSSSDPEPNPDHFNTWERKFKRQHESSMEERLDAQEANFRQLLNEKMKRHAETLETNVNTRLSDHLATASEQWAARESRAAAAGSSPGRAVRDHVDHGEEAKRRGVSHADLAAHVGKAEKRIEEKIHLSLEEKFDSFGEDVRARIKAHVKGELDSKLPGAVDQRLADADLGPYLTKHLESRVWGLEVLDGVEDRLRTSMEGSLDEKLGAFWETAAAAVPGDVRSPPQNIVQDDLDLLERKLVRDFGKKLQERVADFEQQMESKIETAKLFMNAAADPQDVAGAAAKKADEWEATDKVMEDILDVPDATALYVSQEELREVEKKLAAALKEDMEARFRESEQEILQVKLVAANLETVGLDPVRARLRELETAVEGTRERGPGGASRATEGQAPALPSETADATAKLEEQVLQLRRQLLLELKEKVEEMEDQVYRAMDVKIRASAAEGAAAGAAAPPSDGGSCLGRLSPLLRRDSREPAGGGPGATNADSGGGVAPTAVPPAEAPTDAPNANDFLDLERRLHKAVSHQVLEQIGQSEASVLRLVDSKIQRAVEPLKRNAAAVAPATAATTPPTNAERSPDVSMISQAVERRVVRELEHKLADSVDDLKSTVEHKLVDSVDDLKGCVGELVADALAKSSLDKLEQTVENTVLGHCGELERKLERKLTSKMELSIVAELELSAKRERGSSKAAQGVPGTGAAVDADLIEQRATRAAVLKTSDQLAEFEELFKKLVDAKIERGLAGLDASSVGIDHDAIHKAAAAHAEAKLTPKIDDLEESLNKLVDKKLATHRQDLEGQTQDLLAAHTDSMKGEISANKFDAEAREEFEKNLTRSLSKKHEGRITEVEEGLRRMVDSRTRNLLRKIPESDTLSNVGSVSGGVSGSEASPGGVSGSSPKSRFDAADADALEQRMKRHHATTLDEKLFELEEELRGAIEARTQRVKTEIDAEVQEMIRESNRTGSQEPLDVGELEARLHKSVLGKVDMRLSDRIGAAGDEHKQMMEEKIKKFGKELESAKELEALSNSLKSGYGYGASEGRRWDF